MATWAPRAWPAPSHCSPGKPTTPVSTARCRSSCGGSQTQRSAERRNSTGCRISRLTPVRQTFCSNTSSWLGASSRWSPAWRMPRPQGMPTASTRYKSCATTWPASWSSWSAGSAPFKQSGFSQARWACSALVRRPSKASNWSKSPTARMCSCTWTLPPCWAGPHRHRRRYWLRKMAWWVAQSSSAVSSSTCLEARRRLEKRRPRPPSPPPHRQGTLSVTSRRTPATWCGRPATCLWKPPPPWCKRCSTRRRSPTPTGKRLTLWGTRCVATNPLAASLPPRRGGPFTARFAPRCCSGLAASRGTGRIWCAIWQTLSLLLAM